ncbi:hypothetical protein ACLMJK_004903 [Lecanora helva]
MSTLSYGLNITKKPPVGTRPPPPKRKTIFDDESGAEDDDANEEESSQSITTIGGLHSSSKPPPSRKHQSPPPEQRSKPSKTSQYGDLSSKHTSNKHSKNAQEIDPSIYDYDAIYDSLHAKPASSSAAAAAAADVERKPKYMGNLLAAAEVRKRDQLRAKEKMLAKERELEGDEFADKEKFVTGAYKRQQEEMRRLEEEEAIREREAEERKRREGGGMKALYKNMLDRDEQKHKEIMKAVEENKGKEDVATNVGAEAKKAKSEAEMAKEKGATVNEEGQVVDKRQLLNAGLNAASAPKPRAPPNLKPEHGGSRSRTKETARERETRMFEEQLLGKRSASEDSDEDQRAAKSRKLEDELLGLGTP